MPDYINRALKWTDHNRYTVLSIVAAVALSAYVLGCAAVGNFRGDKVTAAQLDRLVSADRADLDAAHAAWVAEGQVIQGGYDRLATDTTAAVEEIAANQALIDKAVTDAGSLIVDAASGSPASSAQLVGLGIGWLGLLGAGKAGDKKRTDGILAKVKVANGGKLPLAPPDPAPTV